MHAGTLSHVAITTVDNISEPRVCASCSFTNDSTARGCSVELQNDEFTFVFNMSRQSSEELTLLECFPVPEAGVFSVSVYEVQLDGSVGYKVWRLPDVTTLPSIAQSGRSGKCFAKYFGYISESSYGHRCCGRTCCCAVSCLCGSGCTDSCYLHHEMENAK